MDISKQQKQEAVQKITPVQERLYSDPESGTLLVAIADTHQITGDEQYTAFAIAIGDVILGLVPQEKLPELLMERIGVERPTAMRITADVLDFLAPLDQPEPVKTTASTVATTVPINSDSTPEPTNDNSLASEIAEAEAAMKTLEPIKTMRHDMEVMRSQTAGEPVHTTASQADLLDHAANVKDRNPDSRWNTEQS
jgi:hypothetical protein